MPIDPKAILYNNVWWPNFLFSFLKNSKQQSTSPAATFNPASALSSSGKALEISIPPSNEPKKRTLIIDADSFEPDNSLDLDKIYFSQQVALLKRLQVEGFEIFLRSDQTKENQSNFHKLDKDLNNISTLKKLSKFYEDEDYKELSKQAVARDMVKVLSCSDLSLIAQKLKEQSDFIPYIGTASELTFNITLDHYKENINEAKDYRDLKSCLATSTKDELLGYLKSLTKEDLESKFNGAAKNEEMIWSSEIEDIKSSLFIPIVFFVLNPHPEIKKIITEINDIISPDKFFESLALLGFYLAPEFTKDSPSHFLTSLALVKIFPEYLNDLIENLKNQNCRNQIDLLGEIFPKNEELQKLASKENQIIKYKTRYLFLQKEFTKRP